MSVIETTAVFEGREHLHLMEPVPTAVSGIVRAIVLFDEKGKPQSEEDRPDFYGAIGSYYRDYPNESLRDSSRWLKELREGDAD